MSNKPHSPTTPASPPTPADRPGADIVLYDGQCRFCVASVHQLMWWDCQGKLAYLSLHDPKVAERWPDISLDRLHEEMCVVQHSGESKGDDSGGGEADKPPGRRHWGPYAIRYLSGRLRRLWWLALPMRLPGAMLIAKPLYRLVARNRYLIAGPASKGDAVCDTGACDVRR